MMGSRECPPEQGGGRELGGARMRPAATSGWACSGLSPPAAPGAPHRIPRDHRDGEREYVQGGAPPEPPVRSGAGRRVPDVMGSSLSLPMRAGKASTGRDWLSRHGLRQMKRPHGCGRQRADQGSMMMGYRLDGVPDPSISWLSTAMQPLVQLDGCTCDPRLLRWPWIMIMPPGFTPARWHA